MPPSTSPTVIRFADCPVQPWANGGGTTRVIAVYPDDVKDAAFDWRLSVATVNSGDFSRLPGVDRVIVLVDGPTMALTIDGAAHALDPLRPRRFTGESVVSCEVSQECLDLNVMTRREVQPRPGVEDLVGSCVLVPLSGSSGAVRSQPPVQGVNPGTCW
ncbi:MAG: uncharacterized protein QOK02_1376 [Mycobacterium sp.]|nr:uncharacterized protein [Mycobacterium sp.]